MLCADQLPACNGRNCVAGCCLHACFVESHTLLKHSEVTKATAFVFWLACLWRPCTQRVGLISPHQIPQSRIDITQSTTWAHLCLGALPLMSLPTTLKVPRWSIRRLSWAWTKSGCNISFDFRSQDNAWPLPVLVLRSMLPGYSATRNVQRSTANCRSKIGASLSRIRSCSACSSFASAMTPLIQLWEVLSSLYRWQCAWNHSLWAFRSFCCGDNSSSSLLSSSLLSSSRCPQLRVPKTHGRRGAQNTHGLESRYPRANGATVAISKKLKLKAT